MWKQKLILKHKFKAYKQASHPVYKRETKTLLCWNRWEFKKRQKSDHLHSMTVIH